MAATVDIKIGVRRIITFLRWHQEDYDALAPSPFVGVGRRARNNGGSVDADEPVDGDEDQRPATPNATPLPLNGGLPFAG